MTNDQISLAISIAVESHDGQTRKWGQADKPYIIHPMRVASRVAMRPHSTAEMIAAAWLHDVVEDTAMKAADLHDKGVGDRVIEIVIELTKQKLDPGLKRDERKRIERERLAKTSHEAKIIKLADRIDNLTDAISDPKTPKDFVQTYRKESKLLLDALTGTDAELEKELRMIIGCDEAGRQRTTCYHCENETCGHAGVPPKTRDELEDENSGGGWK